MKFTWGEIQLTSIQKMFLNNTVVEVSDLPTMKNDNKYKTYFNAMPQVANEGILRLLSRSRPNLKKYEITQLVSDNLLSNTLKTFVHTNEDIEYECDRGLSYYFEVDNMATVLIYVNDVLVETINNTSRTPGIFTSYKGYLDNSANNKVKIVFSGDHPYNYRYMAIYSSNYQYENNDIVSIPNFGPTVKYNLKQLIPDFYKIDRIYYESGSNSTTNMTNFETEGDYTLLFDRTFIGNFIIYYQSCPPKMTKDTLDDYIIEMEPEVLCLLPLYIVSELYKDDDITLATVYRNQFETGLENIYQSSNKPKFTSKSGWL